MPHCEYRSPSCLICKSQNTRPIDNKNFRLKISDKVRLIFEFGMKNIKVHDVVQYDDSMINEFGYMVKDD